MNSAGGGTVLVGELVEAGAVGIHQSPPTVISGDGVTPMLTGKDIRLRRGPSRYGDAGVSGAVLLRAGDIAVAVDEGAVRVWAASGQPGSEERIAESSESGQGVPERAVLLGPGVELVRVEVAGILPGFLGGVLRAALDGARGVNLHEVALPRLVAAEQHRYAAAFAELDALEAEWERRAAEMRDMVRAGYAGLANARLRPT